MGKMMREVLSHTRRSPPFHGERLPEFFTLQRKQGKRTSATMSDSSNFSHTEKCRICQLPYTSCERVSVGQCQHFFCHTCMINYAAFKVNIGQEVMCPEQGCSAKMNPGCELFSLVPEKIQGRFKAHQLWRQSMGNPNIRVCPSETCPDGLLDLTSTQVQCPRCRKHFCHLCMMEAHPGRTCDEQFNSCFKDWKRCPRCGIFIEKIDGCNHIVCRCQYQFCFSCLSQWNDNHYECREQGSISVFGVDDTEDGLYCEECVVGGGACPLLTFFLLFLPFFLILLLMSFLLGILILCLFSFLVMPVLMLGAFPTFTCYVRLLIIVFFPVVWMFVGCFSVFTHFRREVLTPVWRSGKKYFNTISILLSMLH